MSEEALNCVFIPANFNVSDVRSVVYSSPQLPSFGKLSIEVNGRNYPISAPRVDDKRVIWEISTVCDFYEDAPDVYTFSLIISSDRKIVFNLRDLVFLGPSKVAKLVDDVFLLEFVSGIYARKEDYTESTVSFKIDSILTLDYKNVLEIKNQLAELETAQKAFEEKKKMLTDNGIDLNKLASLKAQYDECMKEKRVAQYNFEQQSQKIQAETIHQQIEQNNKESREKLAEHFRINREKMKEAQPEQNMEAYNRLLKFRIAALNELKMIFPFSTHEGRLCSVHYFKNAQDQSQWGEMKAFLGFATHYIREVSRVVGVPLQYNLIPLAGSSRIVDRLTDENKMIPTDYTPQTANQAADYEGTLIACAKHILETLMIQFDPKSDSLLDFMIALNSINSENLATLIPKSSK